MINAFLLSNQHNDYLENKVAYDLIFDNIKQEAIKMKYSFVFHVLYDVDMNSKFIITAFRWLSLTDNKFDFYFWIDESARFNFDLNQFVSLENHLIDRIIYSKINKLEYVREKNSELISYLKNKIKI